MSDDPVYDTALIAIEDFIESEYYLMAGSDKRRFTLIKQELKKLIEVAFVNFTTSDRD